MPGAYYNEHDRHAAAWLRALIDGGHIAPGVVDERDIREVQGDELAQYTQVHLFAGIGGWSYALRLAGWPDDRPIWTGSCPCQPFSEAGLRRGVADERHLWPEMLRLISQRAPAIVFGEQVASARGCAWLADVRADLESLGFAVAAADLPAACVGTLHARQRIWWGAYAGGVRPQGVRAPQKESWTRQQFERLLQAEARLAIPAGADRLLADGLPSRVGQLRGYGNAIEPHLAALYICSFCQAIDQVM